VLTWLRAKGSEISAILWSFWLGNDFSFYITLFVCILCGDDVAAAAAADDDIDYAGAGVLL